MFWRRSSNIIGFSQVVTQEKPELEQKRNELVRAINKYQVQLTELENELLEKLSNAPEDILSEVSIVEGLETTKRISNETEQKVELAQKQEININIVRLNEKSQI
jgi:dynein heavy chain, axonemal